MDYANTVKQKLFDAGVRVEIDDRNEKIGKKIRDTEIAKVPLMLVVGEKDVNENKVSVRRHGKGDLGMQDISSFLEAILEEIKERKGE